MGERFEFTLPSLGADMDEGTLLEWHVAVGDRVERGDIVALVDTEKSEIDLEIWHGGTIVELLVPEGSIVPVGTPLALLEATDAEGAPPPAASPAPEHRASPPAPAAAGPSAPAPPAVPPSGPAPAPSPSGRVRSPLVRHLAETAHLDLSRVPGSGPGGIVTRHDVEAAARTTRPAPPGRVAASPLARRLAAERGIDLDALDGTGRGPGGAVLAADLPAEVVPAPAPSAEAAPRSPAERMRRAVADLMARSKREIPHYYLALDIDMAAATSWLEQVNAERPVTERLLPAAVLAWAAARAAAAHPELNGFWVDGAFRPAEAVHLGVGVSLRGGGLVAPAIHDADSLSVTELMQRLKDVVARTRSGRLRSSEMSDPTITVTSLGDRGPDLVHGVIYPPQVALVGFGRIRPMPVAVDDAVVVRPVVTATLAADHRATDGDRGARMLATLDRLLQHPEEP